MKLLAVILLPIACIAQISSVATTGDGAKLWIGSGYGLVAQPDFEARSRVLSLERDRTILVEVTDGPCFVGIEHKPNHLNCRGRATRVTRLVPDLGSPAFQWNDCVGVPRSQPFHTSWAPPCLPAFQTLPEMPSPAIGTYDRRNHASVADSMTASSIYLGLRGLH